MPDDATQVQVGPRRVPCRSLASVWCGHSQYDDRLWRLLVARQGLWGSPDGAYDADTHSSFDCAATWGALVIAGADIVHTDNDVCDTCGAPVNRAHTGVEIVVPEDRVDQFFEALEALLPEVDDGLDSSWDSADG